MAIAPYLPNLRRELDRLFDSFAVPSFAAPAVCPFPALNVWADGENLFAEAEVPGLRMEDLELSIQGDELTVRGRRRPIDEQNATYLRRERGAGEFVRYISLPFEVNADQVDATLRDGVLLIRMPKSERAKARKIQVRPHSGGA